MMKELTPDRQIRLGIFEEFHSLHLKTLKLLEPEARKSIHKYCTKLKDCYSKGIGVFLWGKNGRGKTASAVAIMKEAHKLGYTVYMISLSGAKDLYTSGWYDNAKKDAFNKMVREVEFLVIDEIGKDRSRVAIEMLENLVRFRTQMGLPIIAVSNNNLEQLEANYKNQSLTSMFKGNFWPVFFGGDDIRGTRMATEISKFLG